MADVLCYSDWGGFGSYGCVLLRGVFFFFFSFFLFMLFSLLSFFLIGYILGLSIYFF